MWKAENVQIYCFEIMDCLLGLVDAVSSKFQSILFKKKDFWQQCFLVYRERSHNSSNNHYYMYWVTTLGNSINPRNLPPFPQRQAEAQRGEGACPRSHSPGKGQVHGFSQSVLTLSCPAFLIFSLTSCTQICRHTVGENKTKQKPEAVVENRHWNEFNQVRPREPSPPQTIYFVLRLVL